MDTSCGDEKLRELISHLSISSSTPISTRIILGNCLPRCRVWIHTLDARARTLNGFKEYYGFSNSAGTPQPGLYRSIDLHASRSIASLSTGRSSTLGVPNCRSSTRDIPPGTALSTRGERAVVSGRHRPEQVWTWYAHRCSDIDDFINHTRAPS